MDWQALRLSLALATLTTGLLLLAGLPLAYWMVRTRSRARPLVEVLVSLPLVLPPHGAGLLPAGGPGAPGAPGGAFEALAGHTLPFSFQGLLLASLVYNLPLSVPGIVAGAALVFAHTLGEFGVALMVGGNLPGTTRTISIALFDDVQALDYAAAHRAALLLVGLSSVALLTGLAARRRGYSSWGGGA